jgi:hypothetical protein
MNPPASLGVQMQADEDSWSARSSRSRIRNQTDISSIRDIVKAASITRSMRTAPSLVQLFAGSRSDEGSAMWRGARLTAVFEHKDGWGRIFTTTPRFEDGNLIVEGKVVDEEDHETMTHGWEKDPDGGAYSRRVHKLPIFCWPMIEGLENTLTAKKLA